MPTGYLYEIVKLPNLIRLLGASLFNFLTKQLQQRRAMITQISLHESPLLRSRNRAVIDLFKVSIIIMQCCILLRTLTRYYTSNLTSFPGSISMFHVENLAISKCSIVHGEPYVAILPCFIYEVITRLQNTSALVVAT